MTPRILDKRFIVVAGKGGVGKSTLCAALGLAAARAGKRTVIAELNTREKISQFFGKPPSGYEAQEVHENLFSMNIVPDAALHEYGLMKLKFERVYRMVFENGAIKRLLKMIPGMNELFMLGKCFNMERERLPNGEPTWDLIIVDAPATGHGVSLLRLPQVILEISKTGPMADEMRLLQQLLTDPKRTVINLVTLPEEMPVRETEELSQQNDELLKIPRGYLFTNGVWPEALPAEQQAIIDGLPDDVPGALNLKKSVRVMAGRRKMHEGYLAELAESVPMHNIQIPFIFTPDFGFDAIDTISQLIVSQMLAIEAIEAIEATSDASVAAPEPTDS